MTIYDEHEGSFPSDFVSPTNSISKDESASKVEQKSKRKHRLGLSAKPAPASAAVQGTGAEKKRTQDIADSIDLGMEVTPDQSRRDYPEVERRRGTVAGHGEPNRIVKKGDGRLDLRDVRRASIGAGLHGGKRRCSVG